MSKWKSYQELKLYIKSTMQVIKGEKVKNGDIILIKNGTLTSKHIDQIAREFGKTGRQKCILVLVESFDPAHILFPDEDMMRQAGWQKAKED